MTATQPAKPTPPDAVALLKADHEAVIQLFAEYDKNGSNAQKKALVAKICTALTVHTQIEEEMFYPAVQTALENKLQVPEARFEHTGMKDLIAQLQGMEPDGGMYDARVMVLLEHLKHHVTAEQHDVFPKATTASLDMTDLGLRMAARKNELLAQTNTTSKETA
jgi:hemerythrin superfamily protein